MNKPNIQDLEISKISSHPEFDQHYRVIRFEEPATALVGFIAIHRNRGRLATGGTRYATYPSEHEAVADVLRLSRAMTAKCVVSGLPYGGAKAVIIAKDSGNHKNEKLLTAYAEVVNALEGTFRTGEDVGMTESDIQFLMTRSKYFNGKSGVAGDPSPFAAKSVASVIRNISELHLPTPFTDLTIGIKGIGKVGSALAEICLQNNLQTFVADVNRDTIRAFLVKYPLAHEVPPVEIPFMDIDIYAPCAFGDEINEKTVESFKTKIICGSANNQLAKPKFASLLLVRGVLYIPDYLANAGGLINVSDELEPDGYDATRVEKRIENLCVLAKKLYLSSRTNGRTFFEETEEYVSSNI